jgi:hypothetical protein
MRAVRTGLVSVATFQLAIGSGFAAEQPEVQSRDNDTSTPIKHVIVIIGENRSFDHVYATYMPKHGEKVWNLLSEGIIDANGKPGPNFHKAHQYAAFDKPTDPFLLSPPKTEFPSSQLPAPLDPRKTVRKRIARELLSRIDLRRHGPRVANSGHAHHGRQFTASRTVSTDERHQFNLQRICRKPGAPFLPDVATTELQRGTCDLG